MFIKHLHTELHMVQWDINQGHDLESQIVYRFRSIDMLLFYILKNQVYIVFENMLP
jgi:hypothetical protein